MKGLKSSENIVGLQDYLVMRNKLNYRPDIDGLRAVAVLAVIFYRVGFGLSFQEMKEAGE